MSLILVLVIVACVLLAAVLFMRLVVWRLGIWTNSMIAAFPDLFEVAREQRAKEAVQVDKPPAGASCPRCELDN